MYVDEREVQTFYDRKIWSGSAVPGVSDDRTGPSCDRVVFPQGGAGTGSGRAAAVRVYLLPHIFTRYIKDVRAESEIPEFSL